MEMHTMLRSKPRQTDWQPPPTLSEIAIPDSAKIAALRDLALAESGVSNALDRLTGLAAKLLGVPVALVTLIGGDKQLLLGQHGLRDGGPRQMPISHSFCPHAVEM